MSVELGFETIGNATIVAFDHGIPILATDPWTEGDAYFGSWAQPFDIPPAQKNSINAAKYVWVSHGHPDHLSALSLAGCSGATFLIPDHVGSRIHGGLSAEGYKTRILPSNQWLQLSDNIRVICFADWNQDSVLLVDIAGKDLLVNMNDGQGLGWGKTIKRIIGQYENRFLLRLTTWGDADMINFYDEAGAFIQPAAATKPPVGAMYSQSLKWWNCNYALPFSCFHRYQRTDSAHMNAFVTPLEEHFRGFDSTHGELLGAHIIWDSERSTATPISPDAAAPTLYPPEHFGDSWSDELDADDKRRLDAYFGAISHLPSVLGKLHFVVGGKTHTIALGDKAPVIIFEVPRNSLMTAINYEVFDDLLIGNFMKTTLVGLPSLYPDFTPYVSKYADNGLAKSPQELRRYFREYMRRSRFNFVYDRLIHRGDMIFRRFVPYGGKLYDLARPIKYYLRY